MSSVSQIMMIALVRQLRSHQFLLRVPTMVSMVIMMIMSAIIMAMMMRFGPAFMSAILSTSVLTTNRQRVISD